jgi:DNA repair/transcription protein MET18/MMS19
LKIPLCLALIKKGGDISAVVEELGPALTNKETEIRLKGTRFLSNLLKNLPIDFLTQPQIEFIVQFYCDRMKDHHSIAPEVINGLLAIVKMKNFPPSFAPQVLQSMFTNIPCQNQVREDRSNIFTIIQLLSESCHDQLEALGADFVFGVIQQLDGERDPRNLLFLYEFMPKFIAAYPLKHFAEEMFEVFSCYFPIDFHPSPNDPKAITRDGLAEKLEVCLCAHKDFAQFCYALALEKLDTDLTVAKLDSLSLMVSHL